MLSKSKEFQSKKYDLYKIKQAIKIQNIYLMFN